MVWILILYVHGSAPGAPIVAFKTEAACTSQAAALQAMQPGEAVFKCRPLGLM